MQLLLIRHAIAEDKDVFARTGKPDSERPLTSEGAKKMTGVAEGLREILKSIDVLGSSPFVRARQTAQIVADAYGIRRVDMVDSMEPDQPFENFATWLRTAKDEKVVAAVGHEPHIGALVTWLLSGSEDSLTPMKKGGACLLEIDGRAGPASAELSWFMPPGVLRRLG